MDQPKSSSGNSDTATEIGYLIVAGFGLLLLQRLWTLKFKPLLAEYVPALRPGGDQVSIAGIDLPTVDLVVLGVLLIAVLVCVMLIRSKLRARRRRAAEARSMVGAGTTRS